MSLSPSVSGPRSRAADWLRLRCWQSRLLALLILLVAAWSLDRPVFLWCEREPLGGSFDDLKSVARAFGEPLGIAFVLVGAGVLDLRRRRPLALVLVGVVAAGGIAAAAKLLIGRDRPHAADGQTVFHGPQPPEAGKRDPSFPSGHTSAAFALASGLARLYPRGRSYFTWVAACCGASRILTGQHFVSDVLVGAWLGWELAGIVWNWDWLRTQCNRAAERPWYPKWNWDATSKEE